VAVTRLNRKLRQQALAGLSPAQASALGTVNRLANPTLGELAEAEQVQPPTATRLVSSLESAGLVIRALKNAFLTRRLAALGPAEQAQAEALTSLLEHLVADV
jgi:DNA-binding MarR family transcriptional regulator